MIHSHQDHHQDYSRIRKNEPLLPNTMTGRIPGDRIRIPQRSSLLGGHNQYSHISNLRSIVNVVKW